MEKVYLRDSQKITVLEGLLSIVAILENTAMPDDIKKADTMRKIFVNTFSINSFDNYPDFVMEVAKLWENERVGVDIEALKKDLVEVGILTFGYMKQVSPMYLQLKENSDKILENCFIYDSLYYYFENNLKKIIISEMFKRYFNMAYYIGTPSVSFKIKIQKDRINDIFQDENFKNKVSFFDQQLKLWATYNKIIHFLDIKLNNKELLIQFDILKNQSYF